VIELVRELLTAPPLTLALGALFLMVAAPIVILRFRRGRKAMAAGLGALLENGAQSNEKLLRLEDDVRNLRAKTEELDKAREEFRVVIAQINTRLEALAGGQVDIGQKLDRLLLRG
jgi:outer membrane murein-binding lipoprotein Lpp